MGGLRRALKPQGQTKKVEAKEETIEVKEDAKAITESEFRALLSEFGSELSKGGKRSLAASINDPLLTFNNDTAHFIVGSKLVVSEFEASERDFNRKIIRAGFKPPKYSFKINATKVGEYKVFTPKQQFEVMAKQFPILNDFRSRFNLNIDE